ncbi:large-conductance mechanosensitive channel [Clostridia bacterium]|nr:large-conductance mechanosensitive channel [Clostridia bacterium]
MRKSKIKIPKIPKPPKEVSKFFTEFKEFAMKGNVIDLAVGVIIGGAFGKITSSLVADVIMPLIGLLLGGVDMTKWEITLPAFWENSQPAAIHIGNFIQMVVDFLIIAFSVFVFVKLMSKFRKKKDDEPPAVSEEVLLLREIRDALTKQTDNKA